MRRAAALWGASVACGVLLTACTSPATPTPTSLPTLLTEQQRSALSLTALQDLSGALASGDVAAVQRLASPDAPQAVAELGDLAVNAQSLGLEQLNFRFVTESPELDPGAPGEWAVTAEVTWLTNGVTHEVDLPVVLRADGAGAAFVTARVGGHRETPLWVLGRVFVDRESGVEVHALRQSSLAEFAELGRRALVDVAHELPRLTRPLVLEVPASTDAFAAVLGADLADIQQLAAITVAQFGARHGSVLVNPGVFDSLGATASQIVISHETVHVALDAAGSGMPMWLMEGYADYVALEAQDLTVTTSASQILAQVRRSGVPEHLPGAKDFNTTAHGVGAVYESAWLACKLIAEQYGEQRLLELYRAADEANDDKGPLKRVLGVSRADFTASWRAYLADLAR